jgi:soluble lytic murein transglycosylase-like protein
MSDIGVEHRREAPGDVFTNVRIRRPVKVEPRWMNLLKSSARVAGAVLLLAAGTLWTLRMQHPVYVQPGTLLHLPPAVITAVEPWAQSLASPPTDVKSRQQVFQVSHFLRAYTTDTARAEQIAGAIVNEATKRNISPALLVGVVLTEDAKLDPHASSSVGARGLMQVMPFHAGKHDCGSNNLFDITANICYGSDILQQLLKRFPSVTSALQHYNGCVHGTNTPNCYTYSGKVLKFADQAATKMLSFAIGN